MFCEDEVAVVVAKVYKIGFSASHPIYIDPTSPTAPPDPYVMGAFPANAHWIKTTGSIVPKPVCYTRNTVPQIQLMITADGLTPELLSTLLVKATCSTEAPSTPYNATLPATPLIPMSSGTTNGYGFSLPIAASAALPNQIDILEPLKIDWEIWDNTGVVWTNATANTPTQHQVYVTLGNSTMPFTEQHQFRTTLDISCRQAKGIADAALVPDAIYSAFATRNMHRYPETSPATTLKYWGDIDLTEENPYTVMSLLATRDGRCGAWSRFFADMLWVQGINTIEHLSIRRTPGSVLPSGTDALITTAVTNFNALPDAPVANFNASVNIINIPADYVPQNVAQFMVKNWTVEANKFYKLISENPENYQSLLSPTNNGIGVNGALPPGLAAQGNNDPYSLFSDHALIRINNKIYDPSYGTGPFNTFADWEVASIQSFGAFINYGSPSAFLLWIEKNNTDTTADLQLFPSQY
ncbi:MAG: hypothetical protein IPN94_24655 [Sphingobacteriales bacterium]|nr:hypothetical protein [Sphingobacteriales bacterium]